MFSSHAFASASLLLLWLTIHVVPRAISVTRFVDHAHYDGVDDDANVDNARAFVSASAATTADNSSSAACRRRHLSAICTIARDERLYLREWLVFHQLVGIDHIYLFDNGGNDAAALAASPLFANFLTVVPFPFDASVGRDWRHMSAQNVAMQQCVDRFARETVFLGQLDVDEFLMPAPSLVDNDAAASDRNSNYASKSNNTNTTGHAVGTNTTTTVATVLRRLLHLPLDDDTYHRRHCVSSSIVALHVPRVEFGSSGHVAADHTRLVTAQFTHVANRTEADDIKPLGFAAAIDAHTRQNRVHYWRYDDATSSGMRHVRAHAPLMTSSLLRINHYYTKSEQEFFDKAARQQASWMRNKKTRANFARRNKNEREDVSMHRYIPLVRRRVAESWRTDRLLR